MPVLHNRLTQSLAAILAGVLLLAASLTASAATPPSQPSAVSVTHRAGQTFLTWTERADVTGERYRVYRAGAPITADALAQATLLYEVAEGSGLFFVNRYAAYASPPAAWDVRVTERLPIADGGPPLPTGSSPSSTTSDSPASRPAYSYGSSWGG